MNAYFLPLGLALAFVVAWLAPQPGARMQELGLIPWMVVTIFLVNGYQTHFRQMPRGRGILAVVVAAILINLLIAPAVGMAVTWALPFSTGAAVGLLVMSAVPSTLTSGIVMTGIAGGNVVMALLLTIVLNLVGVFSIPFVLQYAFDAIGAVELSPWSLLAKLVLLVLVPFTLGMVSRRLIEIPPRHWVLRYLPSTCVIATVWMSMSSSAGALRDIDLASAVLILVGAAVIHGTLLLLCWLARLVLRPDFGHWVALLFTASQKTLPVAIGVLASLDFPIAIAVLASVLFHFLQLLADSLLASRIGARDHP